MLLDVVFSGPRPGRDDPEADRVWLQLRSELQREAAGGPYDPRRWIEFTTAAARLKWQQRRRQWARELFQHDPRVQIGDL